MTPPAAQLLCRRRDRIEHFAAVIYDATVTINDPTPPTLGTVSGPALSGAWLRGPQSLSVDASDSSGISMWSASGDGVTVGTAAGACDDTFTKPCPDLANTPLSINTAALTDGAHQLTLTVRDAADNSMTGPPTAIRTDNTAPNAPALTVTGSATAATKIIHGTVPANQFSPVVAASYVVCNAAGAACSPAKTVPVSGATFAFPVTIPPGQRLIKTWLTDGAGNFTPANAGHVTAAIAARSNVSLATRMAAKGGVTVTVSSRAPGPLELTVSITDRRGHRIRRIVRHLHLHHGTAAVTFHPAAAAHRITAHATYAGSPGWLPGTATRAVTIRR